MADERVPDSFQAPGDDIDRLMYGWSVLFCLPTGMADEPSVGTGTVMRQRTLRRYADEAGYRGPAHRERPLALLPAADLTFIYAVARTGCAGYPEVSLPALHRS